MFNRTLHCILTINYTSVSLNQLSGRRFFASDEGEPLFLGICMLSFF